MAKLVAECGIGSTGRCVTPAVRYAVIGAGIAGLTIAYELATAGAAVDVYADPGSPSTSLVAAGMLAPGAEVTYGETGMAELQREAGEYWKEYYARLESESGRDLLYEVRTSLFVACSRGDLDELHRMAAYQRDLGFEPHLLDGSELMRLEPQLAPRLAGGLQIAADAQVDNRAAVSALISILAKRGVPVHPVKVRLTGRSGEIDVAGDLRGYEAVIVAAGSYTGDLLANRKLIQPLKGVAIRVVAAPEYLPANCIRGEVFGRKVYIVPRANGEIVIGATVEEASLEESLPRIRDVVDLLADGTAILPALRDAEISDITAGFRPQTVDNIPLVGRMADKLYIHGGHYRHGILLAPLTAKLLSANLLFGEESPWISFCSPSRIAG